MTEVGTINRLASAVAELAKGMKTVSFYPSGHPSLVQAISRIIAGFEELPLPEGGLEIDVSRGALLHAGAPLPVTSKATADLNHELHLRRASKVILLPGLSPAEVVVFLAALNRDIREIQDEGGLEQVLRREGVSKIWINRMDYEGLTELIKKEEPPPEEAMEEIAPPSAQDLSPEEATIESLLARIEKETEPSPYRDHVIALSGALGSERQDRKMHYATRALSLFAAHIEAPPRQSAEIAQLALMGVKEIVSDDLAAHYIGRLRDRAGRGRREAQTILAAVGERVVRPLLDALSGEEDLIIRKAIVDVVIRVGRPAVPIILANMSDSRWYTVRNMVTILGSLGLPDLAPHVASALAHPDLRVKKEAIKALSRLSHPSAVLALGDLCFFPEETVALTATAALASKREGEAVLSLYRRAVHRKFFYPRYRLAHEAIDSLRAIGTDDAVAALEDIVRARAVWPTQKFKDMKLHALRSLSKIEGDRARDVIQRALAFPEDYLRWEAERLTKRAAK